MSGHGVVADGVWIQGTVIKDEVNITGERAVLVRFDDGRVLSMYPGWLKRI
jgi:hypothetical protein